MDLWIRKPILRNQAVTQAALLLSLTLAAIPATLPAEAADRMMSVAFAASVNSPQQVGTDKFRQDLIERTEGRFGVAEVGSLALGSESGLLAGVKSGAVDVGMISSSIVASLVPEFGVFDVPFLFRDSAHAKAVAEGPVGTRIATKCAEKGLVLLAIGKLGFRNVTNSKHPVRVPGDLAGLKIRLIPNETYQKTFKALGAEPVPMDITLVYSALKDGRVDGEENPVAVIASNHFDEVQKYLSLTGHFFAAIVFVANRDWFNGLGPSDQAALIAAAKVGADATWSAGVDADRANLERFRKAGMEIIEKVDLNPFIEAVKPLEPEFEKQFGKDVLAAIRSTP